MRSIASAPAKAILFGEHFVVHGVNAILCAIDKRVKVTTVKTDEREIRINSGIGSIRLDPDSPSAGRFGPFVFLAKRAIKEFGHAGGLEITIDSEIPAGVGLGSSSACCVAAAASVMGLFVRHSRGEISRIAAEAERTMFGGASGADSAACTYGGIIEYGTKAGHTAIDADSGLELIIANSGQVHATGQMVSRVDEFRRKNPGTFSSLCKKESALVARAKGLLSGGDLASLGAAMSENQRYLEAIGVSGEKMRAMIDVADRTCHGSKITGAGGGGCIVAVAAPQRINESICNLRKSAPECFLARIDFGGLDTF